MLMEENRATDLLLPLASAPGHSFNAYSHRAQRASWRAVLWEMYAWCFDRVACFVVCGRRQPDAPPHTLVRCLHVPNPAVHELLCAFISPTNMLRIQFKTFAPPAWCVVSVNCQLPAQRYAATNQLLGCGPARSEHFPV
ncbi:hypothetical protein TvY486_0045670 [Trypanosoma vivax Y486]|uniref:Uncharacterized protein n=1 Tax=Trypanosoma vivax (strain Y486) TaxID=1055687 RepID=F9WVP0_TRYVY|nr:hypothetical protein TvY486_0045670 [Trypanosoma vivax Y486]|eukprot:CCD21648.1 hypothetical protein TvY486_0045670 [Trypanosoma vivax Y486]